MKLPRLSPAARRWGLRALNLAFVGVALWVSVRFARSVDWGQVWQALRATPRPVLAAAGALAAGSHALYACYDLLGRRYTGHRLPRRRVMLVNFICYAFNLNMGSLVGAVAFRFRLYSRLGLEAGTTTRIMTLSILTNWLGFFTLGGALFVVSPLPLPPDWGLGPAGLRALGVAMLGVVAAYVALCLRSTTGQVEVRGREVPLPRPRMVLVQLALSCANWSLMGTVMYAALQGRLPYATVLAVLLVGAVAGVITHVPAGLGVLEAVFLALLSHRLAPHQLMAGVLVYRILYYIVPWVVAALAYLVFEAWARRHPEAAAAGSSPGAA